MTLKRISRTSIATLILIFTPLSTAQPAAPSQDLSTTPYRVETLGLRIFLPLGATAQTERFGTSSVTTIIPEGDSGTITVQSRSSKNETLTAQDVADGIISSMRGVFLLTRNQGLSVHGRTADQFYLKAPATKSNGWTEAMMHGVTVFKVADGQFAIFELISDASRFEIARPIYEATVGSAQFVDSEAQAEQQALLLESGSKFLRSLSPADYQRALKATHNRWERLYTPAASGDDLDAQEHGYRRIKAWKGKRGELTPGRPPSLWTAIEKQEGYIIQINAKLLDLDYQVDTEAIYFLSQDRQEEAWTVRMALRQGNEPTEWSETGARSGSDLTISVRQGKGAATTVEPTIDGQGYLSLLETQILGPLLVATGNTGQYAFYNYQSSSGTVRVRSDSIEADSESDGFRVVSRYDDGSAPQISIYTADGALVRVQQPDKRIWEPIEQNRLVQLWDAKGLLED